jgi:hypothetical protein
MVTVYGIAHGRKICVQWDETWFPKGIIYDTAVITPLSCSLLHDTFHLGLGRVPLASMCYSNPLQGISSVTVTTSHVTQGTDLLVTLRYKQSVGFMGGIVNDKFYWVRKQIGGSC